MKEKIFCKICNKQTEYVIDSFSRYHLKKEHSEIENLKHYYDLYLKKDGEGKCLICGKIIDNKRFRFNVGYQRFCSNECGLKYVNSQWDVNVETRRKNNLEKYGVIHPMKIKENNDKRIQTNLEKYGVENPAQNVDCQQKSKDTCMERYGVDSPVKHKEIKDRQKKAIMDFYNSQEGNEARANHSIRQKMYYSTEDGKKKREEITESLNALYSSDAGLLVKEQMSKSRKEMFQTPKGGELKKQIRIKNENRGLWIPLSEKKEYDIYKRNVMNMTYRLWKKTLFDKWDGLDYYTGEKLITNEEYRKIHNIPSNSKMVNENIHQPTIDHKMSIYYGFLNNIPVEEISHIDNLCICSRSNNTKKSCGVRLI